MVWSTPHRLNELKNHRRFFLMGPPNPGLKSWIFSTRLGS
jgi:hypothetical protein